MAGKDGRTVQVCEPGRYSPFSPTGKTGDGPRGWRVGVAAAGGHHPPGARSRRARGPSQGRSRRHEYGSLRGALPVVRPQGGLAQAIVGMVRLGSRLDVVEGHCGRACAAIVFGCLKLDTLDFTVPRRETES